MSNKNTDSKTWTNFYSELKSYSTCNDYFILVKYLLKSKPTEVDFEVCSKIFDYIKS